MRLTPLIVARSQLLTAIELFVTDRDPVSVQALAGNAREILEALCRLANIEPMTELLLKDHPGRERKDIYSAMNLYRNCFKHLGDTPERRADDQVTLDQFDDTKNEYLIYVCVEDYLRCRRRTPIPFQIFQAWFAAAHIDLLAPHLDRDKFTKAFPGLADMSREQQKRGLAAVIEKYSHDSALLSHRDTEPLIIED